MDKRFFIAWIVAFVVWTAGSFAVHGAWLSGFYATMPDIMRTEEDTQALFHFMLVAHIIMAGAFVWIYQRGVENKPWLLQGLRFSIAVALLMPVPMSAIYYVVQQISGGLAVRQALGDSIVIVVVALITAFVSRGAALDRQG